MTFSFLLLLVLFPAVSENEPTQSQTVSKSAIVSSPDKTPLGNFYTPHFIYRRREDNLVETFDDNIFSSDLDFRITKEVVSYIQLAKLAEPTAVPIDPNITKIRVQDRDITSILNQNSEALMTFFTVALFFCESVGKIQQMETQLVLQCYIYYNSNGSGFKILEQCVKNVCEPQVVIDIPGIDPNQIDIDSLCPDKFIQTVEKSNLTECAKNNSNDTAKVEDCIKQVCDNASKVLLLPPNFNATMQCNEHLNSNQSELITCAESCKNNSGALKECILEVCPFELGKLVPKEEYGLLKVCSSKKMLAFSERLGNCVMQYGGNYLAREQCEKQVCDKPLPDHKTKFTPNVAGISATFLWMHIVKLFRGNN